MVEHQIPVLVKSGDKFATKQGHSAIKNGIKQAAIQNTVNGKKTMDRKPDWLKVRLPTGSHYQALKTNVRENKLSTVCEESMCPNIGECWNNHTATIMLMGSVCTRACKFCSVDTGNPKGWLDRDEPDNSADAVKRMGLKYVVLTSVDRDDLDDGGAGHYAACVQAIRELNPETAIEVLTPDFNGNTEYLNKVLDTDIVVFAQNIETIERLTHPVRDPRASFKTTMGQLAYAKQYRPELMTKTSLMVGLGETDEEIYATMDELRAIKVDILTLGQYLRPTKNHLKVERYVTPEQFEAFRQAGLKKGFTEVVSGPFVRSSYRADRVLEKNNAGIVNQAKKS
ncbi:MAG: lipoyl synthase [Gammaproteobacteria bacterium]|nr:lipoyl synthase [Gammaproteobacteria bacterium]